MSARTKDAMCDQCEKPLAWHRESTDGEAGVVATVRMVRIDDGTLQVCDVKLRSSEVFK